MRKLQAFVVRRGTWVRQHDSRRCENLVEVPSAECAVPKPEACGRQGRNYPLASPGFFAGQGHGFDATAGCIGDTFD